jgi:protein-tyrosine-phosphatase
VIAVHEPIRILVVCAANRGRSPIVEDLLRPRLTAVGLRFAVELSSAGICAAELGCVGLLAGGDLRPCRG